MTETCYLGDGCYMCCDSQSYPPLSRAAKGAGQLEGFFTGVVESATTQIQNVCNSMEDIVFEFGELALHLSSSSAIGCAWAINSAAEVLIT